MHGSRASLFRLLGDEDRLRLLALCSEEELTVGELATLLTESQPQITKKTQPLREAGLLTSRREGTRTLLRALRHTEGDATLDGALGDPSTAPIIGAALIEGRALCARDGSLSRIAAVVAQREEQARRFFEAPDALPDDRAATPHDALLAYLPMFAPLLPGHALAVDIGTGDGALLPLLSPLFDRVVAVDRSAARLARSAARLASYGLGNVRLREGDVDDADLAAEIGQRGGADLVIMVRVLHHAARPAEATSAAARLLRRGGHLVVADYLPHSDDTMREEGDVWLGFEPVRLGGWITHSGLELVSLAPLPSSPQTQGPLPLQLAIGRRPLTTAN